MTERTIWSSQANPGAVDLLGSFLALLMVAPVSDDALYFESPWISDFPLLENRFFEFAGAFPECGDKGSISFCDCLEALSTRWTVRLVTCDNETSRGFLDRIDSSSKIDMRYAPSSFHAKGILTPYFFIRGSMNLTYSGVNINDEQITYVPIDCDQGKRQVASAYLEFDSQWDRLND
jgi:hypothetical protein